MPPPVNFRYDDFTEAHNDDLFIPRKRRSHRFISRRKSQISRRRTANRPMNPAIYANFTRSGFGFGSWVHRRKSHKKIRQRRPGANAEIAGYPAHLMPGAVLRRVEGTRAHTPSRRITRSQRKR